MPKLLRCEAWKPARIAASYSQVSTAGLSPLAVARKQTRGARPTTPASSTARSVSGENAKRVRLPGTIPPDVARIVGTSALIAHRRARLGPFQETGHLRPARRRRLGRL